MGILGWIAIVAVIAIVILGAFVWFRRSRRRGSVLAGSRNIK